MENFEERFDPRGKRYYWLAGELVQEIDQPDHLHLPPDCPTDLQANKEGYITLTPLQYNLTDVRAFHHFAQAQDFPPALGQNAGRGA